MERTSRASSCAQLCYGTVLASCMVLTVIVLILPSVWFEEAALMLLHGVLSFNRLCPWIALPGALAIVAAALRWQEHADFCLKLCLAWSWKLLADWWFWRVASGLYFGASALLCSLRGDAQTSRRWAEAWDAFCNRAQPSDWFRRYHLGCASNGGERERAVAHNILAQAGLARATHDPYTQVCTMSMKRYRRAVQELYDAKAAQINDHVMAVESSRAALLVLLYALGALRRVWWEILQRDFWLIVPIVMPVILSTYWHFIQCCNHWDALCTSLSRPPSRV